MVTLIVIAAVFSVPEYFLSRKAKGIFGLIIPSVLAVLAAVLTVYRYFSPGNMVRNGSFTENAVRTAATLLMLATPAIALFCVYLAVRLKKRWLKILLVALAVSILPVFNNYKDGGTIAYSAISYHVVLKHKIAYANDELAGYETGVSFYPFPVNFFHLGGY